MQVRQFILTFCTEITDTWCLESHIPAPIFVAFLTLSCYTPWVIAVQRAGCFLMFPGRERRQVGAQSSARQSYFCSIAGFAVRVHIGKGARRDSVPDLTGSPSPCFRGQKCEPVCLYWTGKRAIMVLTCARGELLIWGGILLLFINDTGWAPRQVDCPDWEWMRGRQVLGCGAGPESLNLMLCPKSLSDVLLIGWREHEMRQLSIIFCSTYRYTCTLRCFSAPNLPNCVCAPACRARWLLHSLSLLMDRKGKVGRSDQYAFNFEFDLNWAPCVIRCVPHWLRIKLVKAEIDLKENISWLMRVCAGRPGSRTQQTERASVFLGTELKWMALI